MSRARGAAPPSGLPALAGPGARHRRLAARRRGVRDPEVPAAGPSEIATTFWRPAEHPGPPGCTRSRRPSGASSSARPAASLSAIVLARFRPLGSALMPYFVAANAVPIIALRADRQPVVRRSRRPRRWPSRPCVLLPGARQHAPRAHVRAPVADRADALVRRGQRPPSSAGCGCPTALPYLFTALKVASVLAMIGAIVGEYFGGSQQRSGSRSRTPPRCSSSRRPGRRSSWLACSGSLSTWPCRSPRRARWDGTPRRDGHRDEARGSTTKEEGDEEDGVIGLVAAVAAGRGSRVRVARRPRSRSVGRSDGGQGARCSSSGSPQAQFAGYYAAKAKGYYKQSASTSR